VNTGVERIRAWRGPIILGAMRLLALGSLARLARWRGRREEGHGWPATLTLGGWRWARDHWRNRTYYLLAAVWTACIFIPFPNDLNPFATTEDAEGYLRALWQVEAAALALSLAIIVFAVQSFRSASQERYGALRRYIRASWLQEGYEQGVVALLVTAIVLAGAGHGGPAGSAGAVAGFACLVSVFVLPPLLNGALRTSRRDFLREERESRLTAAVSEQVHHDVVARHGVLLLSELEAGRPIKVDPFGRPQGDTPMNALLANSVGVVADINVLRLIRLAKSARESGGVTLTTRLNDYVGEKSQLLLLPAAASERDLRLARRVVKLRAGRRRDETLTQYLDDLEEEAVAAIRTGAPATFDAIADAYVETLMEFPRSWGRYGHEYSTAIARGLEFFPTGPVDTIARQFYANIKEALRGSSDDVLLTAAYLPMRVCTRAVEYHAEGLLTNMIRLHATFVAAGWTQGGDKGALLANDAPRHLVEFTRYYIEPRLEEGDISDRLRFGGYARLVYDQFNAVLKLGIDRGAVEFVRSVDGDWDTLLEHWEADEYFVPPAMMVQLEEAASRGEPGAEERLKEASDAAQLAELRRDLEDRRMILRFGLGLWAWRQKPSAWRESFTYFSAQLGGLDQLARITTKAMEAEWRDRVPWSDWILSTLQEGRAHSIGVAPGIVETFVAMALRAVNPDQAPPALPPAEWMSVELDHARNLLEGAALDERNNDVPDVAERAAKVEEAIKAGADAWRQQERMDMIEASLDPEKVATFRERARESLVNARVVPGLLNLAGGTTALDAPPEEPPLIQSQVNKGLFVANSRWVGADMVAQDVGRQTAQLELRTLITPMENVDRRSLVSDEQAGAEIASEFREQLRLIVAGAAQNAEPRSVVVLLPISWQLSEALGFPFLGRSSKPPEEWGLSEGAVHAFAGVFEGVATYRFPHVPKDVLYVVDLARYATAETWQPSQDQTVTVTVLTEEEARERAQRSSDPDKLGEDEIVRRWLETAFITVDPGLRIGETRDDAAVTAVRLPASLTRDVG
jgi:hypothetical protein